MSLSDLVFSIDGVESLSIGRKDGYSLVKTNLNRVAISIPDGLTDEETIRALNAHIHGQTKPTSHAYRTRKDHIALLVCTTYDTPVAWTRTTIPSGRTVALKTDPDATMTVRRDRFRYAAGGDLESHPVVLSVPMTEEADLVDLSGGIL